MDAFLLLGEPDQLPGEEEGIQLEPDNPSKFLLWQDPLTGLFDSQIRGPGLNRYFAILADRLQEAKKHAGEWEFLFEVPSQICSVLSLKAELGSELKKHYATGAHEQLKHMVNLTLPKLIQKVERLKDLHYAQWMKSYKPFGWEVMDIRYGGLLARLRTTQHRLIEYLEGRQTSIPELEEERLPYTTKARGGYVRSNVYKKIVTPNVF